MYARIAKSRLRQMQFYVIAALPSPKKRRKNVKLSFLVHRGQASESVGYFEGVD